MDLSMTSHIAEMVNPVAALHEYFLGVDLGQQNDSTALAVITRIEEGTGEWSIDARKVRREKKRIRFELNNVRRIPLKISYVDIVREVAVAYTRLSELGRAELVIDQTGVGRPVVDLFRAAGLKPIGITFSGGLEARKAHHDEWVVPKLELVRRLEAGLHAGELAIAADQPEIDTLKKEFADFRGHYTAAGNFTVAHRVGKHDDMLLATAIAFWWAARPRANARMVRVTGL